MKVALVTDAPVHNLALMKLSTYHKMQGDEVVLKDPMNADLSYGSWLFNFTPHTYCYIMGGPRHDPAIRLDGLDDLKPDYELFATDYSLGYTWPWCPRDCGFCVVPKQNNPKVHHSIWEFHDTRFNKICLLNNNTFTDPQWRETFEEIWEANLMVIDENGYDLRLLDEEKANTLALTKFQGLIRFAWDRMQDERLIIEGFKIAAKAKLNVPFHRAIVWVLMGYDTTFEEDLYRCQIIHDYGFDPYPMIYRRHPTLRLPRHLSNFRRFILARYYRSYPTLEAAWADYGKQAVLGSGK